MRIRDWIATGCILVLSITVVMQSLVIADQRKALENYRFIVDVQDDTIKKLWKLVR